MTACYQWEGDTLLLKVRVQPRAHRDAVLDLQGDVLRVRLSAPPVEGRANARLIRLIADTFGVPQSQVELVGGYSGRDKRLRIRAPLSLPPGFSPPTHSAGGR